MEFRILGPLEVLDEQHTVRLGAAKQRALLGVLLLHANEAVSTTRLVDELWGERPPATAEKLVQGYVHALRKRLGVDTLVTQAPGYKLLVDPRALDLLEFERLTDAARGAELEEAVELRRRALSLWRGPPLADIVLEGPARHMLGRVSELHLATQIERIGDELELGRHLQLNGELESLAAAHPYQERVHAQLMLALYRSGRQAEALHAYQIVRRRLSDELGLQPGQQLRELEAAILRQDEALSNAGDAAPAQPAHPEAS
ncbi:MAG: AfsR/SARP family transcriptional regulator, partial [Actinobacteria bacterium]|nr:AfsR/SARP family transcriptional regulator [Actinomycetota bacterium]